MKNAIKSHVKMVSLAILLSAPPCFASVVGSNQEVNFNGSSTSFNFGGANFILTDNNDFFNAVKITTQGNASVASTTIFGLEPSAFFDPARSPLIFDSSYQYSAFANPTTIRFSGPPTFIGLRVQIDDDFHYGYAQFAGTLLKSYGFETTANLGIEAGASISEVSPVPLPSAFALLISGFALFGTGMRSSKKSNYFNSVIRKIA